MKQEQPTWPDNPNDDTPMQKYQRHYRSLIQEYRDETQQFDWAPIAEQYLKIFEDNHDDVQDMATHIQHLSRLTATISQIMVQAHKYGPDF